MAEQESPACYEFGGYRLDTHRRALLALAEQRPIALPPLVFDTLVYLVEHPGRLIEKSTLLEAIWPGVVPEENSLNQNISILRRALGESPSEHRFIVTLPGRGYRFVASVRRIELPREEPAAAPAPAALLESPQQADARYLFAQARALSILPTDSNLRGALTMLTRAIEQDPHMACAWSLLAVVYGTSVQYDYPVEDAIMKAESAARRAIELDPSDGASFAALGIVQALRGRLVEAEIEFRRAGELPADPFVKHMHCVYVSQAAGHVRQGLAGALEAYRTRVARQFGATMVALSHALMGEDEEALRWADEASHLGESTTMTPQADLRAQLAFRARRYADAAPLLIGACAAPVRAAGAAEAIELLCAALPDASLRPRTLAALRALEARLPRRELDQVMRKRLLLWYTMLGDLDAACELMDRSLTHYAQRGFVGSAWGALWLPEMRPFRRDPRFQGFAARLGLIEYWQVYGPPDGHELQGGVLISP